MAGGIILKELEHGLGKNMQRHCRCPFGREMPRPNDAKARVLLAADRFLCVQRPWMRSDHIVVLRLMRNAIDIPRRG